MRKTLRHPPDTRAARRKRQNRRPERSRTGDRDSTGSTSTDTGSTVRLSVAVFFAVVVACIVVGAATTVAAFKAAGVFTPSPTAVSVAPNVSVTIPGEQAVAFADLSWSGRRFSRSAGSGVVARDTHYIQAPHTRVGYYWVNDELRVTGVDQTIRLQGKSMQPTLFTGHVVLAETYRDQPLKEGMIIGYNTSTGRTVHRIQGTYLDHHANGTLTGYVVTKGDNNDGDGDRVYPHQVEYVVKGVLFE